MIALKHSVKLKDLQPQIVLAIQIAEGVWVKYGSPLLVVTSCNDSTHKEGSFHYRGLAVDLRIKNISEANQPVLVKDLMVMLGPEYDVIWEDAMGPNAHVHIEWDP